MGIFLGDKPVSVYFNGTNASLPVQGVFLGPVQVFPAGAAAVTLYFNGAVDSDWAEVGNWWLDAEHTQAAGRLPTSDESVVVVGDGIFADEQTINDLAMTGGGELNGTLTVTGTATFNDFSSLAGTVIGNAVFNDSSVNAGGSVTGTATFNDSACNFDGGTAGTFVPDPPPACS
jgi:hypothetical protein